MLAVFLFLFSFSLFTFGMCWVLLAGSSKRTMEVVRGKGGHGTNTKCNNGVRQMATPENGSPRRVRTKERMPSPSPSPFTAGPFLPNPNAMLPLAHSSLHRLPAYTTHALVEPLVNLIPLMSTCASLYLAYTYHHRDPGIEEMATEGRKNKIKERKSREWCGDITIVCCCVSFLYLYIGSDNFAALPCQYNSRRRSTRFQLGLARPVCVFS